MLEWKEDPESTNETMLVAIHPSRRTLVVWQDYYTEDSVGELRDPSGQVLMSVRISGGMLGVVSSHALVQSSLERLAAMPDERV